MLAAAVPAVGGLVSATVRPVANYWKWEGNAEHYRSGGHGKDASALADRAQNTRCAGASFRRSHLAFCPATRSRSQITAVPAGRRTANEVVNTGQWGFGPTNPVRPSPFLLPNYAINQVLLPTGKILLISKPTESPTAPEVKPDAGSGIAHVFDPLTGQYRAVDPPTISGQGASDTTVPNLFCSGHVQLADGRILVAGGELTGVTAEHGIEGQRGLWIFNPWTETWKAQGLMHHGRWYPTLTLLADGRVVIMSGFDEFGRPARAADATHPAVDGERINREVEVFTPNADQNLAGTLERVSPALPDDVYSDAPSHAMDLYPRNVLLPDGRILMAGPSTIPAVLTPRLAGAGYWSWQDLPAKSTFPGSGGEYGNWSTVVLRPFQLDAQGAAAPTSVTSIGGTGSTNHGTTHTFSLSTAAVSAGFAKVPTANSIHIPRAHHNTVQLTDGSMVTIGGGIGNLDPGESPEIVDGNHLYDQPIFSTEIFQPGTNSWTTGPSNIQRRTYHSTALLLPDGRVMSAGDDRETKRTHPDQWRAEYYSPAYLSRGARPTITSAPAAVGYGMQLGINSADADTIRSATLIVPAAVTHGLDMQARMISMPVSHTSSTRVTVTSPINPNVAPPGFYMLVVVNTQGIPSISRWIRVDRNATAEVIPTASPEVDAPAPVLAEVAPATQPTALAPNRSPVAPTPGLGPVGAVAGVRGVPTRAR